VSLVYTNTATISTASPQHRRHNSHDRHAQPKGVGQGELINREKYGTAAIIATIAVNRIIKSKIGKSDQEKTMTQKIELPHLTK